MTRLTLSPSLRALQSPATLAALDAKPKRRQTPAKISVCAGVSWALVDGLRLDVTLNTRGHWAAKARKIAAQRAAVADAIGLCDRPALPCVVTITRRSLGRALDDDNAVSSAKATRDAVAEWLGVDDRDPRVTWVVAQERAPWGVKVALAGAAGAADGAVGPETRTEAVGRPQGGVARDGVATMRRAKR